MLTLVSDQPEVSFEDFWKLYPRKVAKAAARKAWKKLTPELCKAAVNALPEHCRQEQWQNPVYIPHAATWLNGERWEDEIAEPVAQGPKSALGKGLAKIEAMKSKNQPFANMFKVISNG